MLRQVNGPRNFNQLESATSSTHALDLAFSQKIFVEAVRSTIHIKLNYPKCITDVELREALKFSHSPSYLNWVYNLPEISMQGFNSRIPESIVSIALAEMGYQDLKNGTFALNDKVVSERTSIYSFKKLRYAALIEPNDYSHKLRKSKLMEAIPDHLGRFVTRFTKKFTQEDAARLEGESDRARAEKLWDKMTRFWIKPSLKTLDRACKALDSSGDWLDGLMKVVEVPQRGKTLLQLWNWIEAYGFDPERGSHMRGFIFHNYMRTYHPGHKPVKEIMS